MANEAKPGLRPKNDGYATVAYQTEPNVGISRHSYTPLRRWFL
jgi:hypothetical protein